MKTSGRLVSAASTRDKIAWAKIARTAEVVVVNQHRAA
jgi:hypothetical protein